MGDSTYTDVHRGVPRLDNGIVWLKTSDDSKSSQRIFSRRCKFFIRKQQEYSVLNGNPSNRVADTVEEFLAMNFSGLDGIEIAGIRVADTTLIRIG